MRRIFYLIIVIIVTEIGYAQNLVEYPAEELKEDFLQLREHLETKNPITYLYQTRKEVTSFLDSIEKNINEPMTELDFYRLISPVSSIIKDGHNLIMPSSQTLSFFDQNPYNLPIEVAYIDNEVYVTANHTENDLPLFNSKISAINNHSIDSILNRFYLVLPREGLQTQLTKNYINKWFRFFYHLHFGFKEEYRIKFNEKKVLADSIGRTVKSNYIKFLLIDLEACTDLEGVTTLMTDYETQFPALTASNE